MAVAQTDNRDFVFTNSDFERLRELVRIHTGICLAENKQELVYSRIARRLRALQLDTFTEYCELIEYDPGHELEQFTNAISTNLTFFFREIHHFEYLQETVLPELIRANASTRRLRIWSAGCSTGQEPYSLAIVLQENSAQLQGMDAKILATDIDTQVLETGRRGVYPAEQIEKMSAEHANRWFEKEQDSAKPMVSAHTDLKKMIYFKHLNLMGNWPMNGPFDIIFCRNVVIYFDKDTQRKLFDRFADMLSPNGWIFVGHSENLLKVSNRFELVFKSTYRRIS